MYRVFVDMLSSIYLFDIIYESNEPCALYMHKLMTKSICVVVVEIICVFVAIPKFIGD